ncbi:MAG: hypothetical protein HYZ11_00335 [Candidatus Tectomicrobia bacterium]|uniref:SGNH/GDSL hydrolase family protein n=1 Tax=Tectimicrobiota bacterium TaxID=2528274 RepID=A0A932HX90_UNCTE|nr:hypothetical protein [Candidatus Tectomicrobia bacterium]
MLVLAGLLALCLASGRYLAAAFIVIGLVLAELAARTLVAVLSGRGAALVREKTPRITARLLDQFYDAGFDPELGWVRKPNTSKLDLGKYPYSIDARGSRANPGHEGLPLQIGTYGDSYTFCREVEDENTWQWHLAEELGCNVLNFGVGNYGLDQTLLRMKREFPRNPTPITVAAMVPQGIARNLSVWKHYNEFGNVLAFKPRFEIENGRLRLIPNPIDEREKFFRLEEFLPEIRRNDFFYERRFKREAFRPPYLASCVTRLPSLLLAGAKAARRALGDKGAPAEALDALIYGRLDGGGVLQLEALYRDGQATEILLRLVDAFVDYAKGVDTFPVLMVQPMRDDLWYIRNRRPFYQEFMQEAGTRLLALDLAPPLLASGAGRDLFRIWHYSPKANRIVAKTLAEALRRHAPERLSGRGADD